MCQSFIGLETESVFGDLISDHKHKWLTFPLFYHVLMTRKLESYNCMPVALYVAFNHADTTNYYLLIRWGFKMNSYTINSINRYTVGKGFSCQNVWNWDLIMP